MAEVKITVADESNGRGAEPSDTTSHASSGNSTSSRSNSITYDDAIAILIARHGLTYQEAFNTTLEAFRVYAKAYRIRMADAAYQSAMQAWNNQVVKSTKGSGRSVRALYERFDDFSITKMSSQRLLATKTSGVNATR